MDFASNFRLMFVPKDVREAFDEAAKYFTTPLQMFQFYDKYSRFDHEKGRRETWVETVDRAVSYLRELSQNRLPESDYARIREFILHMKAMPSMRLLAMAGEAARRNNIAIYNCSYVPVDSLDAFVEALIISMNGCGVGFSVERRYVNQLPTIKEQTSVKHPVYVIEDTAEGWADALRFGLNTWVNGEDVEFDYSLIRPAGAVLKTKGGRASGPEPLRFMLDFARKKILENQGRKLSSLDALDLMCVVGNAAVQGGTRRTAMIALGDFYDEAIRKAKTGDFETEHWYRWNANISLVWPDRRLTYEEIAQFMRDMDTSGRGEPGIFNRRAANLNKPERRAFAQFGSNPCGEISLRPMQFCNLSIAVARADDTLESLMEKVEVATIIGTIQATATYFPGLRPEWKKNCEEERLLGVDLTGQLDSRVAQDPFSMMKLREHAVEVNKRYAELLGINQAAAVTTVKPGGNSSVLLNVSSGIHPRWSKYYIRRVRISATSPLRRVLNDAGVPMTPENGQTRENATTWVVAFPMKSPEGAITRNDLSALQQCEYWLRNKRYWTEHNPSVTITYRPHELDGIIDWLYRNQDYIGGLTFLPHSDAKFDQMPHEEITKEQYEEMVKYFPEIDFSRLYIYDGKSDNTTAAQELACTSGACELSL